jgi:predicted RNA-binding Zn ribbon-like protein
MSATSFDLSAGALSLDFANTVEWHASEHPRDNLAGFADLLAWAQAAETVSKEQAEALRLLAQNQPEKAWAAFDRTIQLREAIYRLFAAVARQEAIDTKDLAVLNQALSNSLPHMQIAIVPDGFAWEWSNSAADFDRILWPVARSAAELLVSGRLERVRQCADDRGCGYLFLDTSRNGSRRWCSMESCGNRAKAHRHYKRKQKEQ